MNCPSCGSPVEKPGRFCPECGAPMSPESAPPPPPPPPPDWADLPPPPPPPLDEAETDEAETDEEEPEEAEIDGTDTAEEPPPPPPPPPPTLTASSPADGEAAAAGAAGGVGGLLALTGALVAVASAWLPWLMLSSEPFNADFWARPLDSTDAGELANGNYLIAVGAFAAVCGLLLMLRLGRSPGLRMLLALGALAGGAGVLVVEASAYQKLSDAVGGLGVAQAMGWGLYVGAAGGVLALAGGVLALVSRPGAAGAKAGPRALLGLAGLLLILALVGGTVLAWPQISDRIGLSQSSPEATGAAESASTDPSGEATEEPSVEPSEEITMAPTEEPTPEPTPEPSFWTDGYADPEGAIEQFVTDRGFFYGGPCESAAPSAGYCSSFVATIGQGSVYAVGPISSEAEAWVLLREVGGLWYVVDLASAGEGSPPPWD
jgi:hypothetical protein